MLWLRQERTSQRNQQAARAAQNETQQHMRNETPCNVIVYRLHLINPTPKIRKFSLQWEVWRDRSITEATAHKVLVGREARRVQG